MDFLEPFAFTETTSTTYTVHYYNYHIDHIKLNEYAVISIIFYDENQVYLCKKDVKIEGQKYTDWGTDDKYIDDIVNEEIVKLRQNV